MINHLTAGIGEGVKIADLNGHLLLYSKDMRRIGRDYEVVYDAKSHQPVATLQKKMLTMVRLQAKFSPACSLSFAEAEGHAALLGWREIWSDATVALISCPGQYLTLSDYA